MYRIDIGIDLGTSNVRVYMRDKGVVINQPAVVAYEVKTKKIIAVGIKAKKMLGKTPEGIEVVRPMLHGVISNYTLTERMIKAFVKNAMQKRKIWGRPNICVCVPSGITEVEKRAVEDAVCRTGAKQVYVLESSMAAAIGAKLDIMETYGHMVVDIGGGTTDIAVISAGGISEGKSVKVAGDDYTEALIRYVRRKYNILLGDLSAEDVKEEIGTVCLGKSNPSYEVKGKNLLNGLPARIKLTAEETMEAFEEVTSQILNAIYNVMEAAPPELISDVAQEGIVLTGGGSRIYGLDKLVEQKTGIRAILAENAEEVVARGLGTAGEYIMIQDAQHD
jgi:rod shape-determining protein MreB